MLLLALLTSCCYTRSYQGDGRFTDSCGTPAWAFWTSKRFVLDLGVLDLSTTGESRFQIGSLPKARMWLIELDVKPRADQPARALLDEAVVEVTMTNRKGELVLNDSQSIDRWTWTGGYDGIGPASVYLAGQMREIPIGGGDHREEAVTLSEGGRGTFFDPVRNSGYELVIRILTPDPHAIHFDARLRAVGSNYGGSL